MQESADEEQSLASPVAQTAQHKITPIITSQLLSQNAQSTYSMPGAMASAQSAETKTVSAASDFTL